MRINFEKVVELSHPMIPGEENFNLGLKVKDVTEYLPHITHSPDVWYVLSDVEFNSHMGTHIEFPFHHFQDGASAGDYPLENLIGNAVVIDVTHRTKGEYTTLDDVLPYESKIQEGDIIFLRTDFDKLFREENWNDEVHMSQEAMDWLLSKKPKIIGTDATGFEIPNTNDGPIHISMFKQNVAMIESATNLASIQDKNALVFILALPIRGLDSCPVRMIAVLEGGIEN